MARYSDVFVFQDVKLESTWGKHFETGFSASKTGFERDVKPVSVHSKPVSKPVSMKTGFTETGFIVNRSVAGFIENRFRLPVSGSICGHPVKCSCLWLS